MDQTINDLIDQYATKYNLNQHYIKWYKRLINDCIDKQFEKHKHRHHIFPRSWSKRLGLQPINSKINIVKIPYRYHVVAHKLLAKTGDELMIAALEVIVNERKNFVESKCK